MRIPSLRPSILALALLVPSIAGAAVGPRASAQPTPVELRVQSYLDARPELRLEEFQVARLVRHLGATGARGDEGAAADLSDRGILRALRAIGVRAADGTDDRTRPAQARRRSDPRPESASLGGCFAALGGSPSGTGSITGTITEEGTGTPLAGVSISFFDAAGYYVTQTCSGGDGTYDTGPVFATGTYYAATFGAPGHVDERWDDLPCPSGECEPTEGTGIPVTDGGTTSKIDFALAVGGSISGTVTEDGSGTPIEGTRVNIYDASGSNVVDADTAADGTYQTDTVLPAGTYRARTYTDTGYVDELWDDLVCSPWCDVSPGAPIVVAAATPTTGVDFALAPGGVIAGTVTDADGGAPIEGITLGLYTATGDYVEEAYTDGSGAFSTFRGLPTGTYYLKTWAGDSGYLDELWDDLPCTFGNCDPTTGTGIAVTAGATTGGTDFELDLGGLVAGTVTATAGGTPLNGVYVEIRTAAGDYVSSGWTGYGGSGDYVSLRGLPTGTYYATTYNSSGYVDELYDDIACPGQACDVTTGDPIAVTLGATTGSIDFALDVGGSISGTVTEAAGGTPLADLRIRIVLPDGQFVDDPSTYEDGTWYTQVGLPAGTYYVRTDNDDGYLDQVYDGLPCGLGCDPTAGTGISVALATPTGGVDFALVPGGAIAGTVTDATTLQPVPYPFVRIYDADGERLTSGGGLPNGTYQSRKGLPTGTYYVVGFGEDLRSGLYGGQPCPMGVCPVLGGTPVVVTSPATTGGIDLALEPRYLAADGFESGGFGAWTGGSGAAPLCAHSICAFGPKLDPACDPCVAAIEVEMPWCTSDQWEIDCVRATYEICGFASCEWIDWDND